MDELLFIPPPMLKETFTKLLANYTDDDRLTNELWTEIEEHYSAKNRHYHNLQHLDSLYQQLAMVRDQIAHWETILFSLFYHDIIYNPLKSNNEEKSAELAEKRMKQLTVPDDMIVLCKAQILATKTHLQSTDNDTNYFTDADLSILGQAREVYSTYSKNVRKEYAMVPDLLYKRGRKKVLNHFLSLDRIFKTDFFYSKYEQAARRNLAMEL